MLLSQVLIHNYGHGGCGHSLHWGCAEDTVTHALSAAKTLEASPAKSERPAGRYEGAPPVIKEGPMTLLPKEMRARAAAAAPIMARL